MSLETDLKHLNICDLSTHFHWNITSWRFQWLHSVSLTILNVMDSCYCRHITNYILTEHASHFICGHTSLGCTYCLVWRPSETFNPEKTWIYSELLDLTHLFEDFLFVFAQLLVFQFPLAEICLQPLDALIQCKFVSVWGGTDTLRV